MFKNFTSNPAESKTAGQGTPFWNALPGCFSWGRCVCAVKSELSRNPPASFYISGIDKKAPRNRRIPGRFRAVLSVDGNRGGLGQLLLLASRQREFQDTVLKLGGHILGLHAFAHIEAAAAGAGVPLLTDIPARLVRFLLIQDLGGTDDQIAVLF